MYIEIPDYIDARKLQNRQWQLLSDVSITIDNTEYVILKDFTWDGGTIPRIAWCIDSPMGDGAIGYLWHDMIYRTGLQNREYADLATRKIHKKLGLNVIRRNIIWFFIRLFGWISYYKADLEELSKNRVFIKTNNVKQ